MKRAAFFVDGFNLYHSLLTHPRARACKWLDLRGLCEGFLQKSNEKLERITYFSALATWDPGKVTRHRQFIKALRNSGIEDVLGEFKQKDRKCWHCKGTMSVPEEKMTDVSIAVRLLRDAYLDQFDTAFLMTGDTDLIPAIRTLRELHSDKQIVAIFPLNRVNEALKKEVHRYMRTKVERLERHVFPESIPVPGGEAIACPASWLPLPKPPG